LGTCSDSLFLFYGILLALAYICIFYAFIFLGEIMKLASVFALTILGFINSAMALEPQPVNTREAKRIPAPEAIVHLCAEFAETQELADKGLVFEMCAEGRGEAKEYAILHAVETLRGIAEGSEIVLIRLLRNSLQVISF
jgi:hypothetical protein